MAYTKSTNPATPSAGPRSYQEFVATGVAAAKVGLAAQLEAGAAKRLKR